MTDFDYEVKQKKSLVPSARHRKNGVKSKKCTLPSDNLTEAQKRKLNGPVYSVKMDQPMTWEELKTLPDTLRSQYLTGLIDTYDASQRMLGDMLGVSRTTVNFELDRLGISTVKNLKNSRRGPQAYRRMAAWGAFCNGVVGGGNSAKPSENEQIEPADAQVESAGVQIVSEDAQVEDAGVQIVSEDAQVEDAEIVAQDEAHEPEQTAKDGKQEYPEEGDKSRTEEAPGPRSDLTRLAAEYDGGAEAVYASIGELMALFGGKRVHVKIMVWRKGE